MDIQAKFSGITRKSDDGKKSYGEMTLNVGTGPSVVYTIIDDATLGNWNAKTIIEKGGVAIFASSTSPRRLRCVNRIHWHLYWMICKLRETGSKLPCTMTFRIRDDFAKEIMKPNGA